MFETQTNPQAAHFARVHEEYVRTYFDMKSMKYWRRFLTYCCCEISI